MSDDDAWSALERSRGGFSEPGFSEPGFSGHDATSGEGGASDFPSRYGWRDEIGAGGMGAVHIVHDVRLGRDVAYKRVRVGVGGAEEDRLIAWEARITACLEHPTIVPIYDVGGDGESAYYTMRIVRGRSLGDAMRDETVSVETLLRAFATLCQGIAYAHSQGVVHRDLKPANVMLGAFGEVQIVDWGLAALLATSTLFDEAERATIPPRRGGGTTGYASPEQTKGEAPSIADDVYSLGALLKALLDARRNTDAALSAIAERATSAKELRYAGAVDIADELQRYFDGMRVRAHRYTAAELLRWSANRWRVPLVLAAVAIVVGAVVAAAWFEDVAAERTRALAAEASARRAEESVREELARTSDALAWALEEQAVAALSLGGIAEAEVAAVGALGRRASPIARGVLAAIYAAPRPRGSHRAAHTQCEHEVRSGRVRGALCLDGGRARFSVDGAEAWAIEFTAHSAVLALGRAALLGDGVVSVRRLADGTEVQRFAPEFTPDRVVVSPGAMRIAAVFRTRLYSLDGEAVPEFNLCDDRGLHALALGDEHVAAACDPGHVRIEGAAGARTIPVPFGGAALPAFSLAFSPGDEHIALGGLDGSLLIIDAAAGSAGDIIDVGERPLARLEYLSPHRWVAYPEGGVPSVVDLRAPSAVLRLPVAGGASAFVQDGRVIARMGQERWIWEPPPELRPSVFSFESGLSSAAFGGEWVAAARGDGIVSIRSRRSGEAMADIPVSAAVIKSVVAVDPWLFAATAGDEGVVVIDTRDWSPAGNVVGRPVQRLAVSGSVEPEVWALGYAPEVHRLGAAPPWSLGRVSIALSTDIAASASTDAYLLGRGGALFRFDGQDLEEVRSVGRATDIAASGDTVIVAHAHRLERVRGGDVTWSADVPTVIDDVAVSEEWIAAGLRSGETLIWSHQGPEVVARLPGGDGRISWVGFVADKLATASWDGEIRLYALSAFGVDAAEARAAAEELWPSR